MKKTTICILCVLMCLVLCACGKSEAVKNTEAAIEAIGTVTLDSGAAIEEAENLYAALPEEEKEQVENYELLLTSRDEYNQLRVSDVESKINGIGTVTLDSGNAITQAREAYDALDAGLQSQVSNYSALETAEEDYEFAVLLDTNLIKNYQNMSAYKPNLFEEGIKTWYGDLDAAATLMILYMVQGSSDKTVVITDANLSSQYICISESDNRVDIYAPYGDGLIMGYQYWPEAGTSQIGTVASSMEITDYLDMLVKAGIIDSYKKIPLTNIQRVLNAIG